MDCNPPEACVSFAMASASGSTELSDAVVGGHSWALSMRIIHTRYLCLEREGGQSSYKVTGCLVCRRGPLRSHISVEAGEHF